MAAPGKASWTMTNSTIRDNVGPWLGGGLWLWDTNSEEEGTSPTLINVDIENNYSSMDGGGVLASNSNSVLENCTIKNNGSDGNGGGVCFWDGCSPVLTNCLISGNEGSGEGGGVYTTGDAITMTRCAVVDNNCSTWNGGISVRRCQCNCNKLYH